ncbi:MAG: hypothetical protein AAGJ28_20800 [Pseudomonadota bacterium]
MQDFKKRQSKLERLDKIDTYDTGAFAHKPWLRSLRRPNAET